jgi:hypothetical protein
MAQVCPRCTVRLALCRSRPQRRELADLPVAQLTLCELVVNLNTAKNLGLAIPPLIFACTNEVMESSRPTRF